MVLLKAWCVIVGFCLTILNGPVSAEGVVRQISLDEAIEQSLEKSRRRQISQQSIEIAQARYNQAVSGFRPAFDLIGSVNRRDQNLVFDYPASSFDMPTPVGNIPVNVPSQRVDALGREYYAVGIEGRLPLYTGGLRDSLTTQAQTAMAIAQRQSVRTDLDVVYDTTLYYLGALAARQHTTLLSDTVQSLESILDITKSFYEAGSNSVDKTDYLQGTLALDTAKVLHSQLQHGYESAVIALTHSIGFGYQDRIEPETSDEIMAHSTDADDLEKLIAAAKGSNPEIGVTSLAVDIAQARINEAQSRSRPKVALTGNLSRMDSSSNEGVTNSINRNSWTIGLAFTVPIFDSGLAAAAKDQAGAEFRQAKLTARLVETGIATKIRAIVLDLDTSNRQLQLTQNAKNSADENYDLLNRAYRGGFKELGDVLNSQFLRTISHMNLIRAEHQNVMALAELVRVIGTGSDATALSRDQK